VVGADAVLELGEWYQPEAILAEAQVVAAQRPGFDLNKLTRILGEDRTSQIDILSIPQVDISATDMRWRVSEGRSIRYMTPPAVVDYISQRGLYGAVTLGEQAAQKQ
jgi:nicotinate-nucleotide adenylyltransferase